MKKLERRDFLLSAGAAACAGIASASSTATAATAATAKKAKIRLGQIGTGHAHASGVFSQLRQTDDFEIVGIVENDPRRRQGLGDSYQ